MINSLLHTPVMICCGKGADQSIVKADGVSEGLSPCFDSSDSHLMQMHYINACL